MNRILSYFAIKGFYLIIRSRYKLINQYMFWLFSWSNYVIKYSNLKYEDFITLINSISNQSNIIITTGVVDISIVNDLKEKFFKKIDEKIYYRKNLDKLIYLIYKPSFEDIESLLRKSKILITCHGSITHAANSFLIKKIDILEEEFKIQLLLYYI